ncbi:hypothetical protein [Clostridium botulinum]|nr:hypothetical protein [Clostridium botulinum]
MKDETDIFVKYSELNSANSCDISRFQGISSSQNKLAYLPVIL